MHDLSGITIAAAAHRATLASAVFATLALLPGFAIVWLWSHATEPQRQPLHRDPQGSTF